jgi:hypothetical protein
MNFDFKRSLLALLVLKIKASTQVILFISNIAIPFLNISVLKAKVGYCYKFTVTKPAKAPLEYVSGFAVFSAIE